MGCAVPGIPREDFRAVLAFVRIHFAGGGLWASLLVRWFPLILRQHFRRCMLGKVPNRFYFRSPPRAHRSISHLPPLWRSSRFSSSFVPRDVVCVLPQALHTRAALQLPIMCPLLMYDPH